MKAAAETKFKYCPHCGVSLRVARPPGDHRARLVCAECGFVRYGNPDVLVCCLATFEDRLLWIRRGTEPQKGFWTLPAGFVEERERPEEAAARELREETKGEVDPDKLQLFAVGSLPKINEIYIAFRGELEHAFIGTTPEAVEVGLFEEAAAPWGLQAYPDLEEVIRCFYRDHARRSYGVYCGDWSSSRLRNRQRARPVAVRASPGCAWSGS